MNKRKSESGSLLRTETRPREPVRRQGFTTGSDSRRVTEMLQFLPNRKHFLIFLKFFLRLSYKCNKILLRPPPEKCIIMEGEEKPSLSD